jgi:hypothetical protein
LFIEDRVLKWEIGMRKLECSGIAQKAEGKAGRIEDRRQRTEARGQRKEAGKLGGW